MYGAEVEISYTPNRRWNINLGGGLLDTKITDSDVLVADHRAPSTGIPLDGLELTQAPSWTANAILAHHLPLTDGGTFTFKAEGTARSKEHYENNNPPLEGELAKPGVN